MGIIDSIFGDEDTRYHRRQRVGAEHIQHQRARGLETKRDDYYYKSWPHFITRTVDLRDFQTGVESLLQESEGQAGMSREDYVKMAKLLINYIGTRLYGENAVEELSIPRMSQELGPEQQYRGKSRSMYSTMQRKSFLIKMSDLDLIELK